jgi:hypothetical protein
MLKINIMKRQCVLLILFIAITLPGSLNHLSAQVIVIKGSTHKYSVTPIPVGATYNYNWSVTPGGTSSNFGTGSTSNDILWNGDTGIYVITIFPSKPISNCAGNNQTLSIKLVDVNITWNITSSSQCPKTDNQTGDFSITANYTGVSGAWSFNYSIDNAAPITVNVAAGTTKDLTLAGFTNLSNTLTASHTIRITSVTTADNFTVNYSGAEADAASRLHTVTVEPTPNTSGIIQL